MGRIISLLTSVSRDTTPRTTTFAVRPYVQARRAVAMGSPVEEERDPDDRIDHDEEDPLVPVAPAVRGDRGEDRRGQGDRHELEDLEIQGHGLGREVRDED